MLDIDTGERISPISFFYAIEKETKKKGEQEEKLSSRTSNTYNISHEIET